MTPRHSTAVKRAASICAFNCVSNGMQVISGGHTSSMWGSRPSTPSSLQGLSRSGRQRLPALACQRSRYNSAPASSDRGFSSALHKQPQLYSPCCLCPASEGHAAHEGSATDAGIL